MKRPVKITLIAASALLTLGIILVCISLSTYGFSLERLYESQLTKGDSTSKTADFSGTSDIYINAKSCNVEVSLSDDDLVYIDYSGTHTEKVALSDDGDVIKLTQKEEEIPWYARLFQFEYGSDLSVHIYLPENYKGSVSVAVTSGSVSMSGVTLLGALSIKLTTGNVDIWNATTSSIDLSLVTGDIDITELDCLGNISVVLTTGDADLKNLSAKGITCNTTTGRQELTEVTVEKVTLGSTTGDVILSALDASNTTIITTTGSISGSVIGPDTDYTVLTETQTGSDSLSSHKYKGDRTLSITTTTGDIRVSFEG